MKTFIIRILRVLVRALNALVAVAAVSGTADMMWGAGQGKKND